jgi:branched-chain amino acid transport system ATP-binding protein
MLLDVSGIHTYYGTSHVLFGVNLAVQEGEAVALLGRNGVGKTTTLRSIIGLTKPREGKIHFKGADITPWPVHRIARAGIGFVPENRMIFPDLTVWENLDLGNSSKGLKHITPEMIYDIFPILKARNKQLAGSLSGGEQQMLTIARSILSSPELFLLDEPMEGVAPLMVKEIAASIKKLRERHRMAVLLCEQNFKFAMDLCTSVYLIEKGMIQYNGTMEEFLNNKDVQHKYLFIQNTG